ARARGAAPGRRLPAGPRHRLDPAAGAPARRRPAGGGRARPLAAARAARLGPRAPAHPPGSGAPPRQPAEGRPPPRHIPQRPGAEDAAAGDRPGRRGRRMSSNARTRLRWFLAGAVLSLTTPAWAATPEPNGLLVEAASSRFGGDLAGIQAGDWIVSWER